MSLEEFLKNKGKFSTATIVKQGDDEVCIALNNEDDLLALVIPKFAQSPAKSAESTPKKPADKK
ncbi:hypothetical protein [Helicobacter sp. 23-1045]